MWTLGLTYSLLFFLPVRLIPKDIPYSYALYDRAGTLLGASVAADGQWRFSPGAVPEVFEKAVITFEDKRFYYHAGFDLIAIMRAAVSNIRAGRIVSGASTISMQTMRLLAGNPPRTVMQKVQEAVLAFFAELRLGKARILSLYAAHAPFGGNVVGLEAASWRYFNRAPASLTWAEAAVLAVLPNQPALVYPGANRAILLRKRNKLLDTMHKKGYFDRDTLLLSLAEPLPEKPYALPSDAPHYLQLLKKNTPETPRLHSTIDSTLQKNTQRILERRSLEFSRKGIHNAACLIIETKTGKVRAYCGNTGLSGRNADTAAVDIIQARRSSGSLLKPFLYAAMLDTGSLLPDQLVIDIPTRIGSYKPDNNVPQYRGAVPASEALSRSLNIPAVRMLREYGISTFLDYLKYCGFTTFTRSADDYGLPLILGGGELTLFETVFAYAELMNVACGIVRSEKLPVYGVHRRTKAASAFFPVSPGAAWLTLKALTEGVRPDDEALWHYFAGSKRIAWKTGTSNGNRDGWAIGTTPEYTVGVWFGNAEGQGKKDLQSIQTAAPVLFELFTALPPVQWPPPPADSLEEETCCRYSGYLAGRYCSRTVKILRPSCAPQGRICPYCTAVSLTPDGRFQAGVSDMHGVYAGQFPRIENRFVLPPSVEYYYTRFTAGYKKLPPFIAGNPQGDASQFSIMFPEQGAKIVIPIEIDGTAGAMVMQAAARDLAAVLYWDIDGIYLGSTQGIHTMTIKPGVGPHILTVTDSTGTRRIRTFEVLQPE